MTKRSSSMAILLIVISCVAATAAPPQVPENIGRLLQDRKYEDAIKAIDAAADDKDAAQDYLAFLKARALHFQKKYDPAIAAFDQLIKDHAKSQWARHARFAKGVSLARKGDFRAAELIYRAEAEYLLSLDRKQEISDIYLEFADAFFKPETDDKKPDYKKALEFYQQALAVGPKPESRVAMELRIAECYQKLGDSGNAIQRFQTFIKDHAEHDLVIEARFRLGESQLAAGNLVVARRTWQDLRELHKAADSDRLPEAAYKISLTYQIPTPQNQEQLSLGVAALRVFIKSYPEHKLASQAHLRIAQSYQNFGRFEDAVASLNGLLADKRYEKTDEIPEARYLLGSSLIMQGKFDDALKTWSEYLVKHPTHKFWSNAQREIINTEFYKAQAAYTKKDYEEARKLWTVFLAKYPLDNRSRTILYRFGQMNFIEKQWNEAIADWRKLVSKYPNTNESSQAQFMIAATLEEKLSKLDDALKEYRKVTWGNHQAHAKRRIARLTAKNFQIATERVFRSNETPTIKLASRNIENVTVRVYSVDLETYFRKMHLARGLEQLDISLIDPDSTFEFKVPDYEKYKLIEADIEVPLPKMGDDAPDAGVMAVTVSSKTLEATTMVLQSDLDVIVKSSRDEVFVFAENMRTGKAWPGARILVSNGTQVFAEGETGDDGVFKKSFKELKSCNDVRVFAINENHTASNVIGLNGLGVAQGLSPKGYIYTDRPAYRAGQMVHVRGIIRQVSGDTYKIEKDKEYQVEVFDNRNRLVHETKVALSEFGSFHTHFILPSVSPQGQYRVLVHDREKQNYQGTFIVHQYQLEPVQLEVDVPRTVYYRGEEIEGTIRASFYYGAPVVGREIRYQLASGRTFTAKTDGQGEIRFKLPTRDYRESQTLVLSAALPERNLQIAKPFFLATQGFSLSASTVRSVYLAGETFELSVEATDAEGKPVATPLKLQVLERKNIAGSTGESLVDTHELKTDKDGKVRTTLTLDNGGSYVLRVEGIDRFENPITTETTVRISDEKDDVRLRILADQHTFKVGDDASIQIHWREAPALGLVTFQGARILEYRLVQLKKGKNKLEIPMTSKLAPNFELAVAVMTDARPNKKKPEQVVRRFHAASSPFSVQRSLQIKLAVKPAGDAKKARPGEDVEVTITTTDLQGKPASAEVSLAMIEQSLMARFSSPLSAIQDFFRGTVRQSAVRTTSSATFTYRPSTRGINAQLLAERDRLEVLEEESRRLADMRNNDGLLDLAGTMPGDSPPNVDATEPALGVAGIAFDIAENGTTVQLPAIAQPPGNSAGGPGQQLANQSPSDWKSFSGNRSGSDQQEAKPHFQDIVYGNDAIIRGFYIQSAQANGSDGVTIDHFSDGSFAWYKELNQTDVQTIDGQGRWGNVNLKVALGGKWNDEQAKKFVTDLAKKGTLILPNLPPHETGYWNPAISTNDKGQTTVTITLPERSTAWSLQAKGISVETLAGEATDELTVKKDLFGQVKLPTAFTDGDQAKVIALVHNNAIAEGKIQVSLKTTIGGKSSTETITLDVKEQGINELVFNQKLELPADAPKTGAPTTAVDFELTVSSGEHRDIVRRSVPLQPYGMPVFSIAGGSSAGDVTAIVKQPVGMTLSAPRLQVIVGPTVEKSLLDVVLAPPTWCQAHSYQLASGADTAVSDLMASLALQNLIGATREAENPHAQSIDARIRSSVSLLVSLQNDDGGWSWAAQGGGSDRYNTARVVWALSLPKAAGYRIADDGFNKSVGFLQSQLSKSRVTDYETKAVLLHALAVAGQGDFPLANQLYRNRQSLSPAGLAHLALAFTEMQRKQTAGELVSMLSERVKATDGDAKKSGRLSWNDSSTELRALYALALEKSESQNGELKKQIDWLMGHRTGHRWAPDKATGPAMLAACRWFAKTQFQGERYKLTIVVNNHVAKELEIDNESRTQTIEIPGEFLDTKKDEQRIRFEITGRGRYTYQCVLGGFVPADKLKSTTQDWKVVRYYEPATLELDGKPIPRGFDVLKGSYSTFRNDLNQLPVARRGHVELRVTRYGIPSDAPTESLDYLVVTEPLPAGTTVIENSVKGGFERFEISPGAITFYIGSRHGIAPIHYDVHGYLPGQYRTTPTVVRNAYRPDRIAVSDAKSMTVLPLGAKSNDKYRLTPRELYELGKRHFDKNDFALASPHLTELVKHPNLESTFYRDTVRMLLDVHLKAGPPNEVVRYFEIIVEKFPDLEIPFAKLIQVGDAYHKIGEYERSYLVFRATVEASFMRESRVAGFLQQQGELLRSIDVMTKLLRQYPPESYAATAHYALAQDVYANAPKASSDAKLREKKVTRIDLIRQALGMLDQFLTANPEDPAADQASFSLANALLELEVYKDTIAACERYVERFPKSDYLDSFWYIIGYCDYALGKHAAALAMCEKVADAKRIERPTGREIESPNKWQAIYILGQIHHSLGKAEDAIKEYARVKDRFPDARQAIEYFQRKAIELPEVATFKPNEPVNVDLKFRNIPSCLATVYRIDLMKFSLLKRNLGNITQINLAGIRPYHEKTIKLGTGKDYRDRETKLKLPLKEEGAYLVVCRGENLHTSGLVLVSPLAVEVQEDKQSGRVRTTVRDIVKDKYLTEAHVKIIGTRNPDFSSGDTDLRGVFVADDIRGRTTVIAQADGGRYAFFRGELELGPPAAPQSEATSPSDVSKPSQQTTGKGTLLKNLQEGNTRIQMEQQKQLQDLYQNDVKSGIGGGFGGGLFNK